MSKPCATPACKPSWSAKPSCAQPTRAWRWPGCLPEFVRQALMLRLLRQLRVNANRNCSAAPSPQATTRDLMQQLSDLSAFSHPQRDELVLPLWSTVWTHTVQVEVQQIPINELQARCHLNSQNSSKLPSSDGPNKPKSFCKARLDRSAGARATRAVSWRQVVKPGVVITHAPPEHCAVCQSRLGETRLVESGTS